MPARSDRHPRQPLTVPPTAALPWELPPPLLALPPVATTWPLKMATRSILPLPVNSTSRDHECGCPSAGTVTDSRQGRVACPTCMSLPSNVYLIDLMVPLPVAFSTRVCGCLSGTAG